jgi:surface protein
MSLPSLIVNNLGYLNLSHLLRNSARALAVVTLTLSLAACGGGSGSSDDSEDVIVELPDNDDSENDDSDNTADTTAPVITLNGSETINLIQNNSYSFYAELGATAVDEQDGNISIVITDNIDTQTVGSYSVTYTATDKSNNVTTATRTVNVVEATPFITTWLITSQADSADEDNTIIIGTIKEGGFSNDSYDYASDPYYAYNFSIDWGDGTVEHNQTEGKAHTYATPGTYTVKITGQFPRLFLYNSEATNGATPEKLLSVEQWGNNIWRSMAIAFYNADNLVFNATDKPDLTQVTSLSYMFLSADYFNSDISNWDVSNVTDMSFMFNNTYAFNQNINDWDVSNVTNMQAMFSGASAFNQDISNWDVSSLENAFAMFNNAHLSVTNYDALLNGWSQLTLQSSVTFEINSYYSEASTNARGAIIDNYNWTIYDIDLLTDIDDTIPPEVTLYGDENQVIKYGSSYIELGASAFDDRDGAITASTTDIIDVNTAGVYTLTYHATDSAGNTANATRRVTVLAEDTTAPVITLKGESSITLEQDEAYVELGAIAIDSGDGVLTTVITGNVNDKVTGTYTVTYTATDSAGNEDSITRTIIVPDDSSAPIITLNGDSVIKLTTGTSYTELGATANDWREGEITNITIDDSDVEINTKGTYTVSYRAADSLNNSTVIYRTVEVLDPDNTDPVITITGGSTIEWTEDFDFNDFGAVASDGRDGDITVTQTNDIDTSTPGTYTITYSATDAAGNTQTSTRTVEVVASTAFITTWDMPTDDLELTIPTLGSGYDYSVNWGDGTIDNNLTDSATHTYSAEGEYTVEITGVFPRLYFADRTGIDNEKLLTIEQWGNTIWSSLEKAFYGATNMTMTATDEPILHQVTNMSYMFSYASNFNGDISYWDVSNVTDMSFAFFLAKAFNQDIGGWDVSNVNTMNSMFRGTEAFNQDLNLWNVLNVTNMFGMFYDAKTFNSDITDWDVDNVTNMSYMFLGAEVFNQAIGDWDVSNVTIMRDMFKETDRFNQDISDWIVNNVTDMQHMFYEATAFDQDISGWIVSNVTNMNYMFFQAYKFNQDISSWDVSNVTSMSNMFRQAILFNQNISGWEVHNVSTFSSMFTSATAFNQDLSGWSVSSATSLSSMFNYSSLSTTNYDAILNNWSTLPLKSNVYFGTTATYSSAGESARQYIIDTYNWNLTDNGLEP